MDDLGVPLFLETPIYLPQGRKRSLYSYRMQKWSNLTSIVSSGLKVAIGACVYVLYIYTYYKKNIYIYIYIYLHMLYVYMYMYIMYIYICKCICILALYEQLLHHTPVPWSIIISNEDFSGDPILASQLAVWVAQTTEPQPTTGVMVKNLVAMSLGGGILYTQGGPKKQL